MIDRQVTMMLRDTAARVKFEHAGWWAAFPVSDRPVRAPCEQLMRKAAALALHADQRSATAGGAACPERVAPRRVCDLASQIEDPVTALGAYLSASVEIDPCNPDGRAFLEDLAEALLMPPTLVRALSRCERRVEQPRVEPRCAELH